MVIGSPAAVHVALPQTRKPIVPVSRAFRSENVADSVGLLFFVGEVTAVRVGTFGPSIVGYDVLVVPSLISKVIVSVPCARLVTPVLDVQVVAGRNREIGDADRGDHVGHSGAIDVGGDVLTAGGQGRRAGRIDDLADGRAAVVHEPHADVQGRRAGVPGHLHVGADVQVSVGKLTPPGASTTQPSPVKTRLVTVGLFPPEVCNGTPGTNL